MFDKNVKIENIGDICTHYMQIYGANTNLMRHIPFAEDGLKIGERRILYTLYELGCSYNDRFKKVSTLVGQVLAYHPHGDKPVYDTLVKLAQPWHNIQCFIEGSGNFGNPIGDSAAASRYIEARLSFYSYKCFFEEFNKNIVDMKPNYSGDLLEPEYLPAKYPSVLINDSFGIGYGISCSLPTYNFKEVCELTLKLIDDPDYEDITLIPDSPTGALIIDENNFKELSETGKGKFKMRASFDLDEHNNIITITSSPLRVHLKDVLKDQIIPLFREGKLPGLKDIEDDYSERNGIKLKLFFKKEVDPISIIHTLYKKTDLEKTYPVNFKLIDDYEDRDFNIRMLLLSWINFRRDTKRRIYNHKITKVRERQHILKILLFILNEENGEKTLRIIKKSENKAEIINKLMSAFGITSLQAENISEMKMNAFSKESYKKYKKEMTDINEKIEKYEKIVKSVKKIDKIIKSELEEGIKLFGEERKSRIISIEGETKIQNTNHLIVFTFNGYVKKLSDNSTSIGNISQGDYPIEIIESRNTTDLLIFDDSGKVSRLPVHILENSIINSNGEKLNKYCNINGNINTIFPKPTTDSLSNIKTPIYFLMITKNGIIKKTPIKYYMNIKSELVGLIIKENDMLKSVKLLAGDKDVVIYTNKGFGVRIPSSDIKETSRMSIGIKAIELTEDEEVIGMDIVNDKDKYLFVLTNKGNGKKCTLNEFKTMERNSKPLRIISLNNERLDIYDENIVMIKTVRGNEVFKAYLKNTVEEIKIKDVIELPRLSKGRKLISVRKGEVIIDIR